MNSVSLLLQEVVEATHKVIYEAFVELTENDREAFMPEYMRRLEAAHESVRVHNVLLS